MLSLGEAPHRLTRSKHFAPRDSYMEPTTIPTCCGPWHNGAGHFVTFYLCQDYWTILDPQNPSPTTRVSYKTNSITPS